MAGVSGNIAQLAWAKQTVKGTPNTTYSKRTNLAGGNVEPSKETDQLSETDSTRDVGDSYTRSLGAGGSPEVYVRDDTIHQLLEGALGAKATTGAGPDYTHTLTPANTLPYYTVYRSIGTSLLMEQFNDCKVNELTISTEAGGPLTASADIIGRSALRLAAPPGSLPAISTQAPYSMNEAAVSVAGSATSLVSSFELTITNNVSTQQTDDAIVYDVVEGLREVTIGYRMIFETLDEYNKFHYGAVGGTVQSVNLINIPLVFTFAKSASNEISFTMTNTVYEEYPVQPDPGGDPIVVDVRARTQRVASVVTAVVKGQSAT